MVIQFKAGTAEVVVVLVADGGCSFLCIQDGYSLILIVAFTNRYKASYWKVLTGSTTELLM